MKKMFLVLGIAQYALQLTKYRVEQTFLSRNITEVSKYRPSDSLNKDYLDFLLLHRTIVIAVKHKMRTIIPMEPPITPPLDPVGYSVIAEKDIQKKRKMNQKDPYLVPATVYGRNWKKLTYIGLFSHQELLLKKRIKSKHIYLSQLYNYYFTVFCVYYYNTSE